MFNDFEDYLKTLYQDNFDSKNGFLKKIIDIKNKNETIVTKFNSLNSIMECSKKIPIISENSIFYENINTESKNDVITVKIANSIGYRPRVYNYNYIKFLTNNKTSIFDWYLKSRQMIENGHINYIPYIDSISEEQHVQDENGFVVPSHIDKNEIYKCEDIIQPQNFYKATPEQDFEINDSTLIPLFNFSIPGLESITPSQLATIMQDYPDKLLSFRNYLQKSLLNFKSNIQENQDFNKEIRLLKIDIEDRLIQLKSNIKNLNRTSVVGVLGAQFVTWSLFVFAFYKDPTELMKIILPGGAIASMSVLLSKYLKEKFELFNSPVSFLLLVSKNYHN